MSARQNFKKVVLNCIGIFIINENLTIIKMIIKCFQVFIYNNIILYSMY